MEAAAVFRQAGYDADTVWDEALVGTDDATIASRVRSEHRILVTSDLNFGNIRAYPPEDHPGLIALRLTQQGKANAVKERMRNVSCPTTRKMWRFRSRAPSWREKQPSASSSFGLSSPVKPPRRVRELIPVFCSVAPQHALLARPAVPRSFHCIDRRFHRNMRDLLQAAPRIVVWRPDRSTSESGARRSGPGTVGLGQ